MQRISLLLMVCFNASISVAQKPLFPTTTDGANWCFIDKKGKKILNIKPLLTDCAIFSEGLVAVCDSLTGKYGYLNEAGNWAILPQYDRAGNFNKGIAIVSTPCDAKCLTDGNGLLLFGYTKAIDKKGKIVLDDNAQDPEPARRFWFDGYNDGELLRVTHGLSVGDIKTMMNRKGELVGQRSGMCCLSVSDNWIVYNTYDGLYYTDTKGNETLRIKQYEQTTPFVSGYAWATDTVQSHILIDKKGKRLLVVDENTCNYTGEVGEGLFSCYTNNHYGYMDTKGKMILLNNYDAAGRFSNGLAHIQLENEAHFYIDKTAKKVITVPKTDLIDLEYGEFNADGYALIYHNTSSFEVALVYDGIVFRDGTTVWKRATTAE